MARRFLLTLLIASAFVSVGATENRVSSPDGRLTVVIDDEGGTAAYRVLLGDNEVLGRSSLGLVTNIGDLTQGLSMTGFETRQVKDEYDLKNVKQRHVSYEANEAVCSFSAAGRQVMDVVFRVSNRDVAFRYRLLPKGETRVCVVEREASGFVMPEGTTTFLCPQSKPMEAVPALLRVTRHPIRSMSL